MLRRRSVAAKQGGRIAGTPWELRKLLSDGAAAPLVSRPATEPLDVAIVLSEPGGQPPEQLLGALAGAVAVRFVTASGARAAADADVVLAAGWAAAPAVLRLPGVRARAVVATDEPAALGYLGWTEGVPVLGPPWLGGSLPAAADAVYEPMPVHRRDELVLVHGDDVLALLAAAELLERRPALSIAVSGTAAERDLPFPCLRIEPGAQALAHAFSSATVAFAPPVRGWRPAAVAMLACGQAVVASGGDGRAEQALGEAVAFARSPTAAADAAERLIDDLEMRADRARAGFGLVDGGWPRVATELVAQLRALG